MENRVTITDYVKREDSIYVNMEVFDAQQNKTFTEEVRFLGDLLYGDFLHPKRSSLTNNCRIETIEYVKKYFSR